MRTKLITAFILLCVLVGSLYSHVELYDIPGPRGIIGEEHVLSAGGGDHATIAGGLRCTNLGFAGVIAGGASNLINNADFSTISGGVWNKILDDADCATISGGTECFIGEGSLMATVNGGNDNVISNHAVAAWIGAGVINTIDDNSTNAAIAGGGGNLISSNASYATIFGGWFNFISPTPHEMNIGATSIGGGWTNFIGFDNKAATLVGGRSSVIYSNSHAATIGGGVVNAIGAEDEGAFAAAVGGGAYNEAQDDFATVIGGYRNVASGEYSAALGGLDNTSSGKLSVTMGGRQNLAEGDYSCAAGSRAQAKHDGSFVWGDHTWTDVASTDEDQFIVRASGGVWFGDTSTVSLPAGRFINTSTGGHLTNTGLWKNGSDRDSKENFRPVDPLDILDKVSRLPITSWNFKEARQEVRHIGPVAQDFHATFGVGRDDKSISTVDECGVVLGAIQGLHQLSERKDGEVKALKRELALLVEKMEDLDGEGDEWEARFDALDQVLLMKEALPGTNLRAIRHQTDLRTLETE